MSGRRYSDIINSARLRPALDRYIQHLQGTATRRSRVGTQGDRQAVNPVWVYPFGLDLGANQVVQAFYSATRDGVLLPIINGVTGLQVLNTIGSNTSVERPGFRAARVVWFRNATKNRTVVTSDVTGLEYLRYAGTRSSCPFGRDDASSPMDLYQGFDEVKSTLRSQPNLAVNRVSLTAERFSY